MRKMAAKRSEMRECCDLRNGNRSGSVEISELKTALLNEAGRGNHHHHHHHHHHHRHHPHLHRTTAIHRAQSVTAFGDFKASFLADPSLSSSSFGCATETDRETEANGTSNGVSLPMRLMLSAYRRKATLDEFMNNGSARARLAKMGEGGSSSATGTGSAEKNGMTRSSSSERLANSKGSLSNHITTIGGREHTSAAAPPPPSRGHTSYSQSRRKQRNKLAAALRRSSEKDAASREEGEGNSGAGKRRGLESAPSLQGIGIRGGSVLRGSRYGSPKVSSLLNASLSAFGDGLGPSVRGNRSMTSLPSVRSAREFGTSSSQVEYLRAPKTANRAKRLKSTSKHHEHVSHLAWQQQLLLLRKFSGEAADADAEGEGTMKPPATTAAAVVAAVPPANLEALQARDKRPSTSMVMEDASRKLEEAQALLFSQSRISREQPPQFQQRARTTTAGHDEQLEMSTSTSAFPPACGTNAGGGGIATASSSTTTRQRPWSRYKTWRTVTVPPPWLAGTNVAKSSQNNRIALMRNGNGRATQNEMEIKLYAMSLVR